MHKKTLFLGVLVTLLIIPQITLAAWWNPLSWFNNWRFSESVPAVETQTLERRIKELEKKLESVESIATSTATTTIAEEIKPVVAPPVSVKPVSAKPPQTSQFQQPQPATENFAPIVAEAAKREAESFGNLSRLADDIAIYIDGDLSQITKTRNQTQAYFNGSEGDDDIADAFIDAYNADIKTMTDYKDYFLKAKVGMGQNILLYTDLANTTFGSKISKKEAIVAIKSIGESTAWEISRDYINTQFEKYKTYRENQNDEYEETFAYLQGHIDSRQSSIPTYTPPIAPLIQIPQTRQTYCNVNNNSISCESFSF